MSYLKQAKESLSWAVKHRRYLHQYPELSLKEKNTSIYCQDIMKSLGYEVKEIWNYGFIADLKVENPKKTIAWRTEMDALPMDEKNTHSYASKNKGVAHLCGHDVHMGISLLAAKLLAANKKRLGCNVRFIFQPNEESPPGGAREMIKNGCLEGVDEIYSLHNDSSLDVGKLKVKSGAVTAATVMFEVVLRGKGTHAAAPHLGLDPLFATAELVTSWQSIISRNIDPTHFAAMSVTKFICGTTNNVIPDEALLAGTIRAYHQEDVFLIEKIMESHLKALEYKGYKYNFTYDKTYGITVNNEMAVNRIINAAKAAGVKDIETNFRSQVYGDDFGYYSEKVMGAYFFLGSGNREKNITAPSHSSRFDVDEEVIALGAAIILELALQA
jgi:amidohydrolase